MAEKKKIIVTEDSFIYREMTAGERSIGTVCNQIQFNRLMCKKPSKYVIYTKGKANNLTDEPINVDYYCPQHFHIHLSFYKQSHIDDGHVPVDLAAVDDVDSPSSDSKDRERNAGEGDRFDQVEDSSMMKKEDIEKKVKKSNESKKD